MKCLQQGLGVFFLLILSIPIYSTPAIQRIHTSDDTVGLYEKFEVQFDLDTVYNNPFDPDEIDITAIFKSPSGKEWKVFGFFNHSWFSWMIRFSPNEKGQWTYHINIKDQSGSMKSDLDTIIVNHSKHHGPIRVSANTRYLEYADGKSYYGVGLWFNGAMFRFGSRTPEKTLDELKELGVNFISTILPLIETIGTGVGRYDQDLCHRVDELLEWLEKRDMILSLNLWFHSFLSETVWPGFNRRWHTNPYQFVCEAKEFYSSTKAWTYQEKLYRYMIGRWGYSRALGIWFIVDEVNGTDGWAYGDSLGAAKWGQKVHDFFKTNDPYGHLTTGTRSGGVKEWWHEGYQIFDLAAREIYEAQGFPILEDGKINPGDTHPLKLSYMNYVNEIRRLWKGYGKPSIIGETGWDHTFYEPSMPGYLALYHNTLWASLSTGLAMTPFWWSYSDVVNDNVVTKQLNSFAQFTFAIPFSDLTNIVPVEVTLSSGDAFAIKSDQLTFGWVVNPVTDVTGDTITVPSLPAGEYRVKLYHTWGGRFFHEENTSNINGSVTFTIPILKIEDSHARYVGQDIAFIVKPVE
jgi:hypothetical protein